MASDVVIYRQEDFNYPNHGGFENRAPVARPIDPKPKDPDPIIVDDPGPIDPPLDYIPVVSGINNGTDGDDVFRLVNGVPGFTIDAGDGYDVFVFDQNIGISSLPVLIDVEEVRYIGTNSFLITPFDDVKIVDFSQSQGDTVVQLNVDTETVIGNENVWVAPPDGASYVYYDEQPDLNDPNYTYVYSAFEFDDTYTDADAYLYQVAGLIGTTEYNVFYGSDNADIFYAGFGAIGVYGATDDIYGFGGFDTAIIYESDMPSIGATVELFDSVSLAYSTLTLTTDDLPGPGIGSGSEWANVRSITLTLDGLSILAGASVIDNETLPADDEDALLGIVDRLNVFFASLATDNYPANDSFANLFAYADVQDGHSSLLISDDWGRTFDSGFQDVEFMSGTGTQLEFEESSTVEISDSFFSFNAIVDEAGEHWVFLEDVERVTWVDDDGEVTNTLALDTGVGQGQNAGTTYRIYQAAYDRIPDQGGLSFWIDQVDEGLSFKELAKFFLNSDESIEIYGNHPIDYDLVYNFYSNVLQREPDLDGIEFWVTQLQKGNLDRAELLLAFADSDENVALTSAILDSGIWI